LPATTATRYAQSIPFYTINGGEASWLERPPSLLVPKKQKEYNHHVIGLFEQQEDPVPSIELTLRDQGAASCSHCPVICNLANGQPCKIVSLV
jgi:hypothetical protein